MTTLTKTPRHDRVASLVRALERIEPMLTDIAIYGYPDVARRWPKQRYLLRTTYRYGHIDKQIYDLINYDPIISRLVQESSSFWANSILPATGQGCTVRMASSKLSDRRLVEIAIDALGIPR